MNPVSVEIITDSIITLANCPLFCEFGFRTNHLDINNFIPDIGVSSNLQIPVCPACTRGEVTSIWIFVFTFTAAKISAGL